MKSLLDLFIEAEQYSTILYHGTGVDNLPGIFSNGLELRKPLTSTGYASSAIYLTPNIKLAARYAAGGLSYAPRGRKPAILEIRLSGVKRHKKMRVDPLDSSQSAWRDQYEDYGNDESFSDFRDNVEEYIKSMVNRFGGKIDRWYSLRSIFDELEELNGFSLHDFIRGELRKYLGEDRFGWIRSQVNASLNGGEFAPYSDHVDGKVMVTASGTLRLTEEYWKNVHQAVYRNRIPPAAIKAVYVRKKDFPTIGGKAQKFGYELLPSEVVNKFEYQRDRLEKLSDLVNEIIEDYQDDPNGNYLQSLSKLHKEFSEYDKIQKLIKLVVSRMKKGSRKFSDLLEELGDVGREMAGYLNDEYFPGQEMVIKPTTWVRLEGQQIKQLV